MIGEKAGRVEEETGVLFSGESGNYCRHVFREEAGIDPERDVYWANVRRCAAKDGELTEAQERQIAKRCGAYVAQELAGIPASTPVLGMGNVPLAYFFGEKGIFGERAIVRRMADGRKYVPLLHPAHVIRAEGEAAKRLDLAFRADIRKVKAWRNGGVGSALFTLVTREKELAGVVRTLLAEPVVFFDLETPSLHPWSHDPGRFSVLAAGFCARPGEAYGIPLAHWDSPLDMRAAWKAVRDILAGPQRKGALHGQHDVAWAEWSGAEVRNFAFDDMLAATLLADRPYTEIKSNLLRLASDWLGEIEYPWLDVDKARMAEYPLETVVGVAMTDAEWELRIHQRLMVVLWERKMQDAKGKR